MAYGLFPIFCVYMFDLHLHKPPLMWQKMFLEKRVGLMERKNVTSRTSEKEDNTSPVLDNLCNICQIKARLIQAPAVSVHIIVAPSFDTCADYCQQSWKMLYKQQWEKGKFAKESSPASENTRCLTVDLWLSEVSPIPCEHCKLRRLKAHRGAVITESAITPKVMHLWSVAHLPLNSPSVCMYSLKIQWCVTSSRAGH